MINLQGGHIDRSRGLLSIPAPVAKERKDKIVPLLDEDRELIAGFPLCFAPNALFFRHTSGRNDAAAYEEVRKITGQTTNKAFDRCLKLEGKSVKGLLALRRDIADNGLITSHTPSKSAKALKFKG